MILIFPVKSSEFGLVGLAASSNPIASQYYAATLIGKGPEAYNYNMIYIYTYILTSNEEERVSVPVSINR